VDPERSETAVIVRCGRYTRTVFGTAIAAFVIVGATSTIAQNVCDVPSLDVPALAALPQLLNVPFEKWPTVNFESTITWDPPNPAPGDTVRFSISIRNAGPKVGRSRLGQRRESDAAATTSPFATSTLRTL
jgi:hypothetical protein